MKVLFKWVHLKILFLVISNEDFFFCCYQNKILFILGFADRQYHRDDGPTENWRFLGLMSFSDPIQKNASSAIEKCRLAGVKVILISGDHPVTACALAKRLNIFSPESETVEDVAIKLGIPVERVGPRYKNPKINI